MTPWAAVTAKSDILIHMTEVTATDAARKFSDLLDAVEHQGVHFTVIRHGRVVARIEPVGPGDGARLKQALTSHPPDDDWSDDLSRVRSLLDLRPSR